MDYFPNGTKMSAIKRTPIVFEAWILLHKLWPFPEMQTSKLRFVLRLKYSSEANPPHKISMKTV